jgi:hypothetical protein
VYHRLTGYTPQPLWVRADVSGDLYYLDEDTQQDVLLTSFQSPVWHAAPKRMCSQDARVLPEPAEYKGPAGRYNSAKKVEYRVNNCADAGVEQELYVENIGMVRRVETTIAGPVAFDLVQAAVGPVTVAEQPGTSFRLGLRQQPEVVVANLRLAVEGGIPIKMTFHSGQEFDLLLRDESGREIWRWSNGRFFTMIIQEKIVGELTHTAEIPLVQNGQRLPDGVYTVEAWLTNNTPERQFATAANFEIRSTPQNPN